MDAPIQPRLHDFGLSDEDLPRLERHWYPPVTAHDGPSPNATIPVRWLKPGHLAILGVVLAALWIFLSTQSITLTALGTLLFGGGLGAIAGMIVAGLIVRPLYVLAATALVPRFGKFRLFKHAQNAYQAAVTEYQLWQQRTAIEFWCSLPGVRFEREVALLYQGLGYHVRLTPGTADGGVDIVLERDGVAIAVQCKAHRKKIGIAVARELVASAKDIGADRMMIACTHGVSAPLGAYATEKGIQIVTAGELARLQLGLKGMGSKSLIVERPASIAERLRRRRAAPPRS